jgi:hypothetical protein
LIKNKFKQIEIIETNDGEEIYSVLAFLKTKKQSKLNVLLNEFNDVNGNYEKNSVVFYGINFKAYWVNGGFEKWFSENSVIALKGNLKLVEVNVNQEFIDESFTVIKMTNAGFLKLFSKDYILLIEKY